MLRAVSTPYFPDGGLTADTFVPIGERWVLPGLKAHFKEDPEAATPAIMAIVHAVVTMQIELARGHEDELAAIVEATESVHRMPFFNVLVNTLYNEPGVSLLVRRIEALFARLQEQSGGQPPRQSTGDLGELYAQNTAIHARAAKLAGAIAQKTGCKTFKAAPTKSPVRVVEKIALAPADADAAKGGAPDYSSACDIERHALSYNNTSQMDTALQYLQALDANEATFTKINREVFGADVEDITFLRTKDRIGSPNSSFYSDIMLNFCFTDDPTQTVFEFQLQHDDLATIRNEGSHKYYNKTRSARELLEALGEEARIPAVTLEAPQRPSVAASDGGSGASAAVADKLRAELNAVTTELKAVKSAGLLHATELKAAKTTAAEQAAELAAMKATLAELKTEHTERLASPEVVEATFVQQAAELKSAKATAADQAAELVAIKATVLELQTAQTANAGRFAALEVAILGMADKSTSEATGSGPATAATMEPPAQSTTVRSRERVLTGLDGDAPHVRGMRDRYSVGDSVGNRRGELQHDIPLRKSTSRTTTLGRVAKILEAELQVVVPGAGAKPKSYHVILTGAIDRPGSGVLEFYSKSGAFKKKYNLSNLPDHKLRIDESCIDMSHPDTGTVQLIHAKKGPYSLQSPDDLSAWAAALQSLQLNPNTDA